jgi:hypothetical protein
LRSARSSPCSSVSDASMSSCAGDDGGSADLTKF